MDMAEFDTSELVDATKPQEYKRRRRRHRRFRLFRRFGRRLRKVNWGLMSIALGGVLLTALIVSMALIVATRRQVDDSWQGVRRVLDGINAKPGTELTLTDFDLLQLSVTDLKNSLASAKTRTSFLRPFDFASSDLDASLQTLDVSYQLTLAAHDMLQGLEPAVFYLAGGDSSGAVAPDLASGRRIVELLDLGRSSFISADAHLATAQTLLDNRHLADVSPDLFVTVEELTSFHSMLADYDRLLLDSPELFTDMLGLDQTKTYLILSQNSDELRPSGGYISTYGWIKVRKGRIVDYFYGPTTDTTPRPPSKNIQVPFQIPDWWINYDVPEYAAWDGSWYADFPTTARLAAWYFDNGGNLNEPVDGVIAIDTVGFELIMRGLEPVTVLDYGETVTADNFREVIYKIRTGGAGEQEHKKFLAALYYQILTNWQSADSVESAALRRAVFQALQEKHIMVYFTNDDLNLAMDTLHWSGKQDTGIGHDYLMVADANLNGSKQNRSVTRELTYDVTVKPDGSLDNRLTVAYDYSARVAENDPGIQPGNYHNIDYFGDHQVFVPAGSQLTETNDLQRKVDVSVTDTHTSFISLFRIAYDDSDSFQYVYSTPPVVEDIGPYRRYRLLIQKQPGMISEMVNIQAILPEDASIVDVTPEPAASYRLQQPILEFRLDLTQDTWIEIDYTE
jgi:hypothetical protein